MIKGTTKSGFEFSIPEGLDSDFRFIKAFSLIKSGDEEKALDGAVNLVSVIFSDEKEEERLYKHLAKDHGGRVPLEVLFEELNEIIEISKQDESVKN